MQPDGIPDDFRGGHQRIDLLDDDKNANHAGDIGPRTHAEGRGALGVEVGDDAGGDQADDVSDVRNHAENGHENADQKPIG